MWLHSIHLAPWFLDTSGSPATIHWLTGCWAVLFSVHSCLTLHFWNWRHLPGQQNSLRRIPPSPMRLQNSPASAPSIALIGAAPFMRLCKIQGMQTFRIHLSNIFISTNSASISEEAPDLSSIPEEYHDFADVFSKAKAEKLAPHRPYDLKINLEEGTSLPIVLMYPLSLNPSSKFSAISLMTISKPDSSTRLPPPMVLR